MAVFKMLSKSYIQRTFTHKALFVGAVPVYLNPETGDVAVRNGVPDWAFDVAEFIAQKVRAIISKSKAGYVPMGDFLITGPISKGSK